MINDLMQTASSWNHNVTLTGGSEQNVSFIHQLTIWMMKVLK